jgi:hypothetical protein
MRNEGSKSSRETINAFHRCLNAEGLLPSQTYIPGRFGFNPVFIINQIVALFISHNYERIPGQINIAFSHFNAFDGRPVFYPYRAIAYDYLCQVTFFLKEYSGIEFDELAKAIPEELLTAGPKNAPNYDQQRQLFKNV